MTAICRAWWDEFWDYDGAGHLSANRVYYSDYDGVSWSAKTLAFDWVANPPTGTEHQVFAGISFLSTGQINGYSCAVTLPANFGFTAQMWFIDPSTGLAQAIDNTVKPVHFADGYGGPWQYNGALWVVGIQRGTNKVYVYKSTDAGHSWLALDVANAPSNSAGFFWDPRNADATTAAKITFIVERSSDHVTALMDFDASTETWGSIYAANTALAYSDIGGVNPFGELRRFSNGDIAMYYPLKYLTTETKAHLTVWDSAHDTWSASLWVSPEVSPSELGGGPRDIHIDSADTVHLFYSYQGFSSPNNHNLWRTWTAGGGLSAPFEFPAAVLEDGTLGGRNGVIIRPGDEMIQPFVREYTLHTAVGHPIAWYSPSTWATYDDIVPNPNPNTGNPIFSIPYGVAPPPVSVSTRFPEYIKRRDLLGH